MKNPNSPALRLITRTVSRPLADDCAVEDTSLEAANSPAAFNVTCKSSFSDAGRPVSLSSSDRTSLFRFLRIVITPAWIPCTRVCLTSSARNRCSRSAIATESANSIKTGPSAPCAISRTRRSSRRSPLEAYRFAAITSESTTPSGLVHSFINVDNVAGGNSKSTGRRQFYELRNLADRFK